MDKAQGEIMLLLASIDPIHRGFEYERWHAYSSAAPYDEVQARFGSAVDPESFDTSMIDPGTSRGVSGGKSPTVIPPEIVYSRPSVFHAFHAL
jgi:hypothetical protein